MKELKGKKGITLVALIITIIVLLILAAVAISAVTGDGIINYAKNAKSEYQAAQTNEEAILGNYTNYITDNINTKKEIQFTIDGVTYTSLEGWDWATWIESDYNTIGVYVEESDNCIALNGQYVANKENVGTINIESAPDIENGDVFVLYGGTPT